MKCERSVAIVSLIERLKCEIELAQKHAFKHTVQLLRIAVLDLQTILASITDEELRELTDALYEELHDKRLTLHS